MRVDRSIILIDSGDSEKMASGYTSLLEALKDDPLNKAIYYNVVAYLAKTHKLEDSISCLEKAKSLGFFSTEKDISFWKDDEDFEELRQSKDDGLTQRIGKLLRPGAQYQPEGACP